MTSVWTSTNELFLAPGPLADRVPSVPSVHNAIDVVSIPKEWADAEYRMAAMEANVANLVAWQVRVNREERGLTQAQLGSLMGTKQSAISKLEDPDSGDVQLSTLVKAAHAFECALLVKLVDYGEFASITHDVRSERLYAAPFSAVKGTSRLAIDHDNDEE